MKTIHFEIDYHTQWGEHLVVIYSVDGARAVKLSLETNDGMSWTASAKIPASARHIRHAYTVTDDNGRVLRTEFNRWRIFHFNHRSEVYFSDAWADDTLPGFYHRVAFSQCLMLPPEVEQPRIEQASASSLLLLHAAPPPAGQVWAVVGGSKAWGEWNAAKARPMQRTGTYEWCLPLTRSDKEDVFVGVNGRTWQIARGVEVELPWNVVKVLQRQEKMLAQALEFEEQASKPLEQLEKKV